MFQTSPAMRSLLMLSVSVVLVVVLLQLTDAVPVKRPERTPQQCPEMDSDWIDRIWSAYKNKFDRTYSEQEDDTRSERDCTVQSPFALTHPRLQFLLRTAQ